MALAWSPSLPGLIENHQSLHLSSRRLRALLVYLFISWWGGVTLHQTVCHLYRVPEMCKLARKLLMCFYHSTVGFTSQIQVTQVRLSQSLDFKSLWFYYTSDTPLWVLLLCVSLIILKRLLSGFISLFFYKEVEVFSGFCWSIKVILCTRYSCQTLLCTGF